MKETLLFNLINSLDGKEISLLKEYIKSSFASSRTDSRLLLKTILATAPHFPDRSLKRETVFKKVYPKHSYDYQKLSNVIAAAKKVVWDFMAIRGMQIDKQMKHWHRLHYCQHFKLSNTFSAVFKKYSTDVGKVQNRISIKKHLEEWMINDTVYFDPKTSKTEKETPIFDKSVEALDTFYLITKLKMQCEIYSRKTLFAHKTLPAFIQGLLTYVKSTEYLLEKHFLIHMYYHLLLLNLNPEDQSMLPTIQANLFMNADRMDKGDISFIFQNLINFSNRRYLQGDTSFLNLIFELYDKGLKQKIVPLEGIFTPTSYSNIISVSTLVGKTEYAWRFAENYIHLVPEEHRKEVKTLGKAFILFHETKYEEATKLLVQLRSNNTYLELKARNMQLRISYKSAIDDFVDYRFFINYCTSFRAYVSKNKSLNRNKKTGYINLINWLKKLMNYKYKTTYAISILPKWEEEIKQMPLLESRAWLLKQLTLFVEGGEEALDR